MAGSLWAWCSLLNMAKPGERDTDAALEEAHLEAEPHYRAEHPDSSSSDDDEHFSNNHKVRRAARHACRLEDWEASQKIWRVPESIMNGAPSAWQHFAMIWNQIHQRSPVRSAETEWCYMSTEEREAYERNAEASLPGHLAATRKWQAGIPLSPSVTSEGSEDESDIDDLENTGEEEDYWTYTECIHAWRRERMVLQQWVRYRRDYQKEQALPQRFHYFFKLPPEIRHQILRLLLTIPEELMQMPPDLSADVDGPPPFDMRVLATSKQMLAEAAPIFYQQNTLIARIYEFKPLPLWITRPSSAVLQLRRLHLWLCFNREEGVLDIRQQLIKVAAMLKDCENLKQIRITTVCQDTWHIAELDVAVDGALLPLIGVTGVEQVVFSSRQRVMGIVSLREILSCGTNVGKEMIKEAMERPRVCRQVGP